MTIEVDNGLCINCSDESLMQKMKAFMFEDCEAEENKLSSSEHNNSNLPDRNICSSAESSKVLKTQIKIKYPNWDGYELNYSEHGTGMFFSYITEWVPNVDWVSSVCFKLDEFLWKYAHGSKAKENAWIEYRYLIPGHDYACIMTWSPHNGFNYRSFSSMQEYFWDQDREVYDLIVQDYCPKDEELAFKLYAGNWGRPN